MEMGSTLLGVEKRLAPVVLGAHVLCATCGLLTLTLAFSHAHIGLFVPCVLLWLLLTGSNVMYTLQNSTPSIGMIPPSIISLGPAALPGIFVPNSTDAASAPLLAMCVAAAITALAMIVWFCRMRATYTRSPTISNDAVVIVLGGAIKHGWPCRTLAFRLNTASRVWQDHPNVTFVLTGGVPAGETLSEADAMARYMRDVDVPPHNLLLETHARNTTENLSLSLDLIQSEHLEGQLCVLSSNYHLYRAIRIGRSLGVDLVPIPAPTPRNSMLQQWCREALTIMVKR